MKIQEKERIVEEEKKKMEERAVEGLLVEKLDTIHCFIHPLLSHPPYILNPCNS